MKIIAFSDTHGMHKQLPPPPDLADTDIMIFAGDCGGETKKRYKSFIKWYSKFECFKTMIFGNHELWCERNIDEAIEIAQAADIDVMHEGSIFIGEGDGIYMWGSPYTPPFCDWAFGDCYRWSKIPDQVDIVVTHGPQFGTLDRTAWDQNAGCPRLKERLEQIDYSLHIHGHIHEARGRSGRHHNVSCADREYELYSDPWTVIEWDQNVHTS